MDPFGLFSNPDDWEEFRASIAAVPNVEVHGSFQFEFAACLICMDTVFVGQANVFTMTAGPSDFTLLDIVMHRQHIMSIGASWEEYARNNQMIITIKRIAEGAFEVSGLVTKSFLEYLRNQGRHDPMGAVGHACYTTVFKLKTIGVFGEGPVARFASYHEQRQLADTEHATLSELSEEASVVLSSESDSETTLEWIG